MERIQLDRGQIDLWLREDIGWGDVTSEATVPSGHQSRAFVQAKQAGIVAGLSVASSVFMTVNPTLQLVEGCSDGQNVRPSDVLLTIEGNTRSILAAERVALNLLQRLSGIATQTRTFVEALGTTTVRIVDTRKTTPGLRVLEKYAVRVGGGYAHRFNLWDAVLIKDNHRKAAGGVVEAVQRARAYVSHMTKIEVEVETLEDVLAVCRMPQPSVDFIMLDNMDMDTIHQAVQLIRTHRPLMGIEVSGGVHLGNIHHYATCGVDVISVGALTHSVRALDISLDLDMPKGVEHHR